MKNKERFWWELAKKQRNKSNSSAKKQKQFLNFPLPAREKPVERKIVCCFPILADLPTGSQSHCLNLFQKKYNIKNSQFFLL